jgi:hypothetical protein
LAFAGGVALSGCGSAADALSVEHLPLADGGRVAAQRYACPVTPDQCFRYVMLRGGPRTTATRLKAAQRTALARAGWHFTDAVTPSAVAADSPDRKTFISFETGAEEIADERGGEVDWDATVGQQLRKAVAARQAVLAVTLENAPTK